MNTIDFGTQNIKIVKSRRNKYMRLSVSPQGMIRLSVPILTLDFQINHFLNSQADWLETTLNTIPTPHFLTFTTGESISILAEKYILDYKYIPNGKIKTIVSSQEHKIYLFIPRDSQTFQFDQRDVILAALKKSLRQTAESIIRTELQALCTNYKFSVANLTIREQKSRWGSCSSNASLNFNWKIILAPPQVFRYVLVHELCHLRVQNHSKQFWQEVASIHPTYNADRRWLKLNANNLEIL